MANVLLPGRRTLLPESPFPNRRVTSVLPVMESWEVESVASSLATTIVNLTPDVNTAYDTVRVRGSSAASNYTEQRSPPINKKSSSAERTRLKRVTWAPLPPLNYESCFGYQLNERNGKRPRSGLKTEINCFRDGTNDKIVLNTNMYPYVMKDIVCPHRGKVYGQYCEILGPKACMSCLETANKRLMEEYHKNTFPTVEVSTTCLVAPKLAEVLLDKSRCHCKNKESIFYQLSKSDSDEPSDVHAYTPESLIRSRNSSRSGNSRQEDDGRVKSRQAREVRCSPQSPRRQTQRASVKRRRDGISPIKSRLQRGEVAKSRFDIESPSPDQCRRENGHRSRQRFRICDSCKMFKL
ncbi:uncharacterized protein [Ptychodera flava]